MNLRLGIDVGSTTVKLVLIDELDNIVYSRYERHMSNVFEKAGELLEELLREKKERRDKEEVEKISDAYERMRRRRSMSERNRIAHGLDVPPKQ